MTKKNIVFLAGLPRTGSTLLTSIFDQNPEVHVDGQSPLIFLMLGAKQICSEGIAQDCLIRVRREGFVHEWLSDIPDSYYQHVTEPMIIDKNFAWSFDPQFLRHYITNTPRILVLVRPVLEIVKSFVSIARQRGDVLPERNLLADDCPLRLQICNTGWALANNSEDYFFGTYDQLVDNPQSFVNQAATFWGIPDFEYDFTQIVNKKPENDYASKTRGLHEIRPQITRREYEVKISDSLFAIAKELDDALQHDYEQAKKIKPERFIA